MTREQVGQPPTEEPAAPGGHRGPWRRALAADVAVPCCAAVLFSLFAWIHIISHPLANTQSTGGEEAIYLWYLGHAPWAVLHHSNPFVTTAINYPAGVNLLWNTSLLTPGLILAPLTELGGVVLTYNVLLVLTLTLSIIACYAACRRFVEWWPAALAGGALMAISPYLMSQARGHLNLILMAVPPLFILIGDELLVRQRMRSSRLGLLLAFLVILQCGSSTEILASSAAVAAVGVVVLALLNLKSVTLARVGYVAKTLLVTVVGSVIVLAIPGYYLFFGLQHLTGQAQASDRFRADLLSPVVPTEVQELAPSRLVHDASTFTGNGFENTAYLGITLILLVLGTVVVLRRNRVVVWAGITALVSLILSLGTTLSVNGHDTGFELPFKALSNLPLLSSGTAVRYSFYTSLLCAVVVSAGADRAHAEFVARRAAGRAWFLPGVGMPAAVVLALAPLVPSVVPFAAATAAVPAYFTGPQLKETVPVNSVLLAYPILNRFGSTPMTWQALAHFRYLQVGDYAITPGPGGVGVFDVKTATAYVESRIAAGLLPTLGSTPALAMRKELRKWDVQTVVVDLIDPNAGLAIDYYSDFFAQAPQILDGVAVWSGIHYSCATTPATGPRSC